MLLLLWTECKALVRNFKQLRVPRKWKQYDPIGRLRHCYVRYKIIVYASHCVFLTLPQQLAAHNRSFQRRKWSRQRKFHSEKSQSSKRILLKLVISYSIFRRTKNLRCKNGVHKCVQFQPWYDVVTMVTKILPVTISHDKLITTRRT